MTETNYWNSEDVYMLEATLSFVLIARSDERNDSIKLSAIFPHVKQLCKF